MITGEYWKLQDDDALGKIDAAAVRLLSGGGVRIEHEEMLDRIDRYCKDAIERYEQPDIDKARTAELRRVFLAAVREIQGTNATCI